jgi:hypothetical protein
MKNTKRNREQFESTTEKELLNIKPKGSIIKE